MAAKTLNEFISILDFLGDEMTEKQAERLMDQARHHLSVDEMQTLCEWSNGPMYSELSQFNAEMGHPWVG